MKMLAARAHRAPSGPDVGWDRDAPDPTAPGTATDTDRTPLPARVLALLSDPRVESLSAVAVARMLSVPRPDAQTALDALVQAGELIDVSGGGTHYSVSPTRKAELEDMFQSAAVDLGETQALARVETSQALAELDDEEPRLPVVAGLLSLFLPGTGQLLNGDVARASLVFAVWSLALLSHFSPIWTFVALYAGAEAFFTSKIRGMERRLTVEQNARRPRAPKPQPT